MPRSRSRSVSRSRPRKHVRGSYTESRSRSRSRSRSQSRSEGRGYHSRHHRSTTPDRHRDDSRGGSGGGGGSGGYRTPVKSSSSRHRTNTPVRDRSSERRGSTGRRDGRVDSRDRDGGRNGDYGRGWNGRGRDSRDDKGSRHRSTPGSVGSNRDRYQGRDRSADRSRDQSRDRQRDRGHFKDKEDRSGGRKERDRDRDRDRGWDREKGERTYDDGSKNGDSSRRRGGDTESDARRIRDKDFKRDRSRDTQSHGRDRSHDLGARDGSGGNGKRRRGSGDRGRSRERRDSRDSDDSHGSGAIRRESESQPSSDSDDSSTSQSPSDRGSIDLAGRSSGDVRDRRKSPGDKSDSAGHNNRSSSGRPPKPPPAMKDSRPSAIKRSSSTDDTRERSPSSTEAKTISQSLGKKREATKTSSNGSSGRSSKDPAGSERTGKGSASLRRDHSPSPAVAVTPPRKSSSRQSSPSSGGRTDFGESDRNVGNSQRPSKVGESRATMHGVKEQGSAEGGSHSRAVARQSSRNAVEGEYSDSSHGTQRAGQSSLTESYDVDGDGEEGPVIVSQSQHSLVESPEKKGKPAAEDAAAGAMERGSRDHDEMDDDEELAGQQLACDVTASPPRTGSDQPRSASPSGPPVADDGVESDGEVESDDEEGVAIELDSGVSNFDEEEGPPDDVLSAAVPPTPPQEAKAALPPRAQAALPVAALPAYPTPAVHAAPAALGVLSPKSKGKKRPRPTSRAAESVAAPTTPLAVSLAGIPPAPAPSALPAANGKLSPAVGKKGVGKDKSRVRGSEKKSRGSGAAGLGRESGSSPVQARRTQRAAAVVAAGKIKSTSEGGGSLDVGLGDGLAGSGLGDGGGAGSGGGTGTGGAPDGFFLGVGTRPDESDEEATLDLPRPASSLTSRMPGGGGAAGVNSSPIGPKQWYRAMKIVDDFIGLDTKKIYTMPPSDSVGTGTEYQTYLAIVSRAYWLKQIQEKVGKKKVDCRYQTIDEFLHDVRHLCANSFVFSRTAKNDLLVTFLRKLELERTDLPPSRLLVPKWETCLNLLEKLYKLGDPIYYLSYPLSVYYIGDPESEPADYAEKIKQPMDMSTVVYKLLGADYQNEGGMVADLRLMVDNCKRYYTNTSNFDAETIKSALANAKVVGETLEMNVRQLLPEYKLERPSKPPKPPTPPKPLTPTQFLTAKVPTTKVSPKVRKAVPSKNTPRPKVNNPAAAGGPGASTPAVSNAAFAGAPMPTAKPTKAKQDGRGMPASAGAASAPAILSPNARGLNPPPPSSATPAFSLGDQSKPSKGSPVGVGLDPKKKSPDLFRKNGGAGVAAAAALMAAGTCGNVDGGSDGMQSAPRFGKSASPAGKVPVNEPGRLPKAVPTAGAKTPFKPLTKFAGGIAGGGAAAGATGIVAGAGAGTGRHSPFQPGAKPVDNVGSTLPLSEAQAKNMGLAVDSAAKAKSKKVVSKLKSRCQKAINNLQQAKLPGDLHGFDRKIFDRPVNDAIVTDYCNIVKTRMDLDSVKSKHRISRYPTVAALFTDVFLVYTNAIKYYEQRGKLGDAVVYKAAKELHALAKAERDAVLKEFLPQVAVLHAEAKSSSVSGPVAAPGGSEKFGSFVSPGAGTAPALPSSAFSAFSRGTTKVPEVTPTPRAATTIAAKAAEAKAAEAKAAAATPKRRSIPTPNPAPAAEKPRAKTPPLDESTPSSPPRKKAKTPFTIPKKARAEKEAREKEAAEKEAREREAREKEAREKEAREEEAREKAEREARERAAETARVEAEKAAKAAAKANVARMRAAELERVRIEKEKATAKAMAEKKAREAAEADERKRVAEERERAKLAAERERQEAERVERAKQLEIEKAEKAAKRAAEKAAKRAAENDIKEKNAKLEKATQEKNVRVSKATKLKKIKAEKAELALQQAQRDADAAAAAAQEKQKALDAAVKAAAAAAAEAQAEEESPALEEEAKPEATPPPAPKPVRTVIRVNGPGRHPGKQIHLLRREPPTVRIPHVPPVVASSVLDSTPGVKKILDEINKSGPRKKVRAAPPAKRRKRGQEDPEIHPEALPQAARSKTASGPNSAVSPVPPTEASQQSMTPTKGRSATPPPGLGARGGQARSPKAKPKKPGQLIKLKMGKTTSATGAAPLDAVAWQTATGKSRAPSPFRPAPGHGSAGDILAIGADALATRTVAEDDDEAVADPEAGEVVVPGTKKKNKVKASGGRSKSPTSGSKPKSPATGSKIKPSTLGTKAKSPASGGKSKSSTPGSTMGWDGGDGGGDERSMVKGEKTLAPETVDTKAEPTKIILKFKSSIVRQASYNTLNPSPPSAPPAVNPGPSTVAPAPSPPPKPKSKSSPSARAKSAGSMASAAHKPSGPSRATGKAGKGKRTKNDKGSSGRAITIVNNSAANGGSEAAAVADTGGSAPAMGTLSVVRRVGSPPLPPKGWGPLTTRGEGGEWRKEANSVLTRLRSRDKLVNDDFLMKYPELDVKLTTVFSLGDEEMPKYLELVGSPIDLVFVEEQLRHGQYFKSPQHFVDETLRVFTNGIIWWSQERFVGYWYATDVIMVCKHLRTTFRALCLELLPLWMWGGKEGEEPTPDPVPTTEEEWEAEHMRPCPLTSVEQKRARMVREAKVKEIKMTDCRSYALNLLKAIKKKDSQHYYWPEVDLTHYPDYISVCPFPMSLEKVESLLGGQEDKNREYLVHGEFIRDMRLIFSNGLAYNNPDRIINELDRGTSMKYYALAKSLLADLEKQLASPYSINVLEESGRNQIVNMIDERREEERKIRLEETMQKNKAANREADLIRAAEEEAEEDRDPVEREDSLRRERKQHKAEIDAEREARKQADAERDDMCEAMWTMSLVHRESIEAAMEESRNWGRMKAEWERQQEETEAAELAAAALAQFVRNPNAVVPGGHWGEAPRRAFPLSLASAGARAPLASPRAVSPAPPGSPSEPLHHQIVRQSCPSSDVIIKETRGKWGAASASPGKSGNGSGGAGPSAGSGGGGSILRKRKLRSIVFGLKKTPMPVRPRFSWLPPPSVLKKRSNAHENGDGARRQADVMDVEPPGSIAVDVPAEAVVAVVADAMTLENKQAESKAVVAAALAIPSPSSSPSPPERVEVHVSKPLLVGSGGGDDDMHLEHAICSDARLVKMHWAGGLVMVSVVVKDALGGEAMPGINITHSPLTLVMEALGTKVVIASPPDVAASDGFTSRCSGPGINAVRHLKDHLHKLSEHFDEHERGGDERMRWVSNLREKRLVLDQVGEILEGQDFHFSPALGGLWMAVYHRPNVRRNSAVWVHGSATPTIEFRVLMRRSRLAKVNGVTVAEDAEYAVSVAQAVAKAKAVEAAAPEEALEENADMKTAQDCLMAVRDRIYDGQVREVVSGVLNGVVQEIMLKGGKPGDLREVVMWKAAESKRLRLKSTEVDNPLHRKFSFSADSDEEEVEYL